jgi:hypothetical protein
MIKRSPASVASYSLIEKNGLLSKRRLEVYSILFKNGALTAHEVVAIARKKSPNANQTGWNARFSELAEMGVIQAVGEKKNPVSNTTNTIWDITGKLPSKLTPKASRKQMINQVTNLISRHIGNVSATAKSSDLVLLREALDILNRL